jgi:GTP-binding protein
LLDLAAVDGSTPEEQERVLLKELDAYRPALLQRPRLLVGSKADVASSETSATWDGLRMSAVTGDCVRDVVFQLAALVDEARGIEPESEGTVVIRPEVEGVTITREGAHGFRVSGRQAERAVALSDLTDPQALAYVDERLKRLGVAKALARAGAQPGDVVLIGEFSFDYEPDD